MSTGRQRFHLDSQAQSNRTIDPNGSLSCSGNDSFEDAKGHNTLTDSPIKKEALRCHYTNELGECRCTDYLSFDPYLSLVCSNLNVYQKIDPCRST